MHAGAPKPSAEKNGQFTDHLSALSAATRGNARALRGPVLPARNTSMTRQTRSQQKGHLRGGAVPTEINDQENFLEYTRSLQAG